jgi:hypothetical protein
MYSLRVCRVCALKGMRGGAVYVNNLKAEAVFGVLTQTYMHAPVLCNVQVQVGAVLHHKALQRRKYLVEGVAVIGRRNLVVVVVFPFIRKLSRAEAEM